MEATTESADAQTEVPTCAACGRTDCSPMVKEGDGPWIGCRHLPKIGQAIDRRQGGRVR